ncbi:hypothetical protein [Myroides sp. N17-2]|uniref:hypothetical protein n=1 Tax=Myroides sp. N17-2 TaxID=2030799 RepID=UPI000EFBB678|nr:hypothetical protein [Myroides sp. N17-2]
MITNNRHNTAFTLKALVSATLPAYFFPTVMSFASGYIMQNPELMTASYTTIGLSSLIATILSFLILRQFEHRQILIHNKAIRALLIIPFMVGLGALTAYALHLPSEYFNIMLSAFIGATIITIRQKITTYTYENN